ncbi:MAG TPA: FtsW/RodA/SpoVE family cell cycle protein, partial [Solirubrobacterales bacterium]|nr:FtsW/RodA/SpoVE family cell cycle protein [Solirubrobacterales bacterium]
MTSARNRELLALAPVAVLLTAGFAGVFSQENEQLGNLSLVYGAYLGVKVGPIAFQPAEFTKLAIIVFLASYLREHREVLIVGARRVL